MVHRGFGSGLHRECSLCKINQDDPFLYKKITYKKPC